MTRKNNLIIYAIILTTLFQLIIPTISHAEDDMYYNFKISSPKDMPKVPGCDDGFDELLYYSGLVVGIDPALLKTIMWRESSGNPNVDINTSNKNGTIDVGIMQINMTKNVPSKSRDAIQYNHLLNVWMSTETIKRKTNDLYREYLNTTVAGYLMGEDIFAVLWSYNGRSEQGHTKYAEVVHPVYLKATKLSKTNRLSGSNDGNKLFALLGIEPLIASGQSVAVKDVIRDRNSMPYDQFAKAVEKLSNGKIVAGETDITVLSEVGWQPTNGNYSGNAGNTTPEGNDKEEVEDIKDTSKGTGLIGAGSDQDVVVNYKIYKGVKLFIQGLNFIINILSILILILTALLWSAYAMALSGVPAVGDYIYKLTHGKVDAYTEGSMTAMVKISLVVIVLAALSMSGGLAIILEKAVVGIMYNILKLF